MMKSFGRAPLPSTIVQRAAMKLSVPNAEGLRSKDFSLAESVPEHVPFAFVRSFVFIRLSVFEGSCPFLVCGP